MSTVVAPPAEALAAGRVHRLGGVLALDGTVSWAPAAVRGDQPVNCYLVRGQRGSVLIDTGVRLHERQIISQLAELVPADEPLSVLLTRTEMDCCLNIPAIEAQFNVEAVYFTGGITVPRARAEARRISVDEGATLAIDPYPDTRLTLFAPRLRLLPTLWAFDPVSNVMFTSDSFAHSRNGARASAVPDAVELAAIREQFLIKHAWITLADPAPVADDLRRIFGEVDAAVLAPTHGRPFVGAESVRRQVELLARVVEGSAA